MLQRAVTKELADLPILDYEEYRSSALYLKKINKIFLNHWLIYKFIKPYFSKKETARVLDVGTGVADLPIYLSEKFSLTNIEYLITGIDTNRFVTELARKEIQGKRNIIVINSDIASLPGSYDLIIISQVLHHLDPAEAVAFLKSVYKKSQKVIISDLIRNRAIYWLVKIYVFLTTANRINRNDGAVSVLRCYNNQEIMKLLKLAGINKFKIYNILFRKVIIITK